MTNATQVRDRARRELAQLADPDHGWDLGHPRLDWVLVHRMALSRAGAGQPETLTRINELLPLALGRAVPIIDALVGEEDMLL